MPKSTPPSNAQRTSSKAKATKHSRLRRGLSKPFLFPYSQNKLAKACSTAHSNFIKSLFAKLAGGDSAPLLSPCGLAGSRQENSLRWASSIYHRLSTLFGPQREVRKSMNRAICPLAARLYLDISFAIYSGILNYLGEARCFLTNKVTELFGRTSQRLYARLRQLWFHISC